MTVAEFYWALQRGQVSASSLFDHFKKGDFTAEEYNAFCHAQSTQPLQEMIDQFYAGELFRAQFCDFVAWCNGNDLFQDRRTAYNFQQLMANTGTQMLEIEKYIALLITPKRRLHKVLAEDPVNLKLILDEYNKRIDNNGWRNWPKQKPNIPLSK